MILPEKSRCIWIPEKNATGRGISQWTGDPASGFAKIPFFRPKSLEMRKRAK
jgi:hypothetical protein